MEANPALIRSLEYPEREGIRQVARSFFVAPKDRDRFLETLTDHGVVLGFETELLSASGRRIPVRTTARAHRGPAGVIEYVEGLVEDVSYLGTAEEPGQEAAAFRALMSASGEGILIVAADGRVLQANARAQSLLIPPLQDVRGGAIWDYFEASAGSAIASALEEIAGARSASVTRSARTSMGSKRLKASFFPLLDPQKEGTEEILVLLEEGTGHAGV